MEAIASNKRGRKKGGKNPSTTDHIQPQYYTCTQAAKLTGLSRHTWLRYAENGKIASTKPIGGKIILIPSSEIERLLGAGFRPAATHLSAD